jgi:NitT/TauT family transport system substrate-binding protein
MLNATTVRRGDMKRQLGLMSSALRPSQRRHLRGRAAAAALVIGLAITASACGSSSNNSSSQTAGNTSSSLGTLTVIGIDAGEQLHDWAGTGLTVKVVNGSVATVAPALASGSAQIGFSSAVSEATAIEHGLSAKIVACPLHTAGQVIIVGAHSGITSVSDLRGKKFGISSFGSDGYYNTVRLAQSLGWSSSQYSVTTLGNVQGLIAALKTGAISAFLWNNLEGAELQQDGVGKNLGSVDKYVPPFCSDGFMVSTSVLKSSPAAVKAFVSGYLKEASYLASHPSQMQAILVNEWGYNINAVKATLPYYTSTLKTNGSPGPNGLNGLAQAVEFSTKTTSLPTSINSIWQSWTSLP